MENNYRNGGYGYGHAKMALLDEIEKEFAPRRARFNELMARPEEINKVLAQGAEKARSVAKLVLARARKACGTRE